MSLPSTPKLKFSHFLDLFPEVELPVQLTAESHHIFSQNNEPLPEPVIHQYIVPTEDEAPDEFTEYIPCFLVPGTEEFAGVVYWRAGLMNYRYVLLTFTKKGEYIDSRVIAGTFSDGHKVTHAVATIDEDLGIVIVSGEAPSAETPYDPSLSEVTEIELLPDGHIG